MAKTEFFNGVFSMTNSAEIMFSELGQVKTDFITQEEVIEINCIITAGKSQRVCGFHDLSSWSR